MPQFTCTAKDKNGKTVKATVEAVNKNIVIEKLQARGLFVVNINEIVQEKSTLRFNKSPKAPITSSSKKPRKFARKNVKLDDLLAFARQLATMLEAGVPLVRSLTVIKTQIESKEFFKVLENIQEDVEQGGSVSLALANHPKVFNQFWISLMEVGEASGTIPNILNKLAFYLEQQASFRSTIISGIIYPAILFVVCLGAISFFALFVGPRFEAIFKSMNADLPMITAGLLALFSLIKKYFFLIIASTIVSIISFKKYIQTPMGREQYERFCFKFPAFGKIYQLIIVERFTSQMAILIDSGVPILYALDIAQRLVDNVVCGNIISQIKESVKEGELLVSPMERSGFFPPMCIQMIMVGEETGELSKMLKHVSKFYQNIVETFMKRFGTIVEPFMLLFMAVIIGTILVAMFLPMFNLSQLGG